MVVQNMNTYNRGAVIHKEQPPFALDGEFHRMAVDIPR